MNDKFLSTLTAELAKHPQLKNLDEAHLKALAEVFDGWNEIATYEVPDFVAIFAESDTKFSEAEARALIAKANAEASGGEVEVQVSASADASASANTAAPSPFGPYAEFLTRSPSAALGGLMPVNPRINRGFVEAAATGVATFVFLATGVDKVLFDEKFWLDAEIENREIRTAIFKLTERMARGEYITAESMREMFDGIDDLLDDQFEELVRVCAEFAGAQEILSMTGPGGTLDIGRFAAPMSRMSVLVPANAERISKAMLKSAMPEQAEAVSEMIKAMMDIMRGEKFAEAVRAPAGLVGDDAAMWFMSRRMGDSFANRAALAQDYEALLRLFAVCPPQLVGPDKTQFLMTAGTLANTLGAHFSLVEPELRKEVQPAKATGFPPALAGVSAQATARASFSISLRISWGRK